MIFAYDLDLLSSSTMQLTSAVSLSVFAYLLMVRYLSVFDMIFLYSSLRSSSKLVVFGLEALEEGVWVFVEEIPLV